jgi:type IV secretory pathway VirB6-like protein
MFGAEHAGAGVDMVAHIIQAALTPVFLLSGIATLLNVFSTRLVRVADQVDAVSSALAMADAAESRLLARKLRNLYWRSLALDAAVILGAIGGAATCGAVLALFVGSLREVQNAGVLFGLFGLAVVCALGGVLAFTVEMLIAGIGIREEVVQSRRSAMPRMGDAAGMDVTASAGRESGPSGGAG